MLYLIRGISGSGKSTLAKNMVVDTDISWYEADMFFLTGKDQQYKFNPSKLKDAHEWCFEETQTDLLAGKDVIVSNTFTRLWEMQRYLDLVKELNIPVRVFRTTGKFKNVHNVPEDVVQKMEERFEDYAGEHLIQPN